MQTVSDKWYKLYHAVSAVITVLLGIACGVAVFVPKYQDIGMKWGLTYIVLILCLLHIGYIGGIYSNIKRHKGIFQATLYTVLIQTLILITLIEGSGKLHSWYLLVWGLLVFSIGMFGSYAIGGAAFMVVIYFVAIMTDNLARGVPLDANFGFLLVGATFAAAIASHMVWKTQYTKAENQKLAQLSGILANKDQQAEILVESIADGVVLINTEGKINLMNNSAAVMSEWPVAEAMGIDVQMVLKFKAEDGTDTDPTDNPFAKALISKQKVDQSLKLMGRNGREQIVSVVVSPIILPDTKELVGVVSVIRDVSSAKAEESRRADFVSTASHEMRTPVAAIEGYLQLALNDKVSQVDAKARGFLEKALDSTHHLGQLFQDLLTSAKAEDGRLVSHPVVVEMGEYLDEISDSLKFSAEKKGLFMEYTFGLNQPSEESDIIGGKVIKPLYYVHVDPDRLREVITNLFDNAVKYTDSGKITIALTGNEEVVQMYIKDTGGGIPTGDLPHLFQKFYRVDNSSTRTKGGSGLGLFICKKIIELYKGRIWVESVVGMGSTFYINLPRLSAQKATELQSQEARQTI